MNSIIVFAAFCLAAVQAGIIAHEVAVDKWAPAHYKFDYGVSDPHTGDKKSHMEVREGDVVKGSYSLLEADGTTRVVEYTADPHNGFNAVVKRIGHAAHPEVVHKVAHITPVVHKVVTPVIAHHVAPVVTHHVATPVVHSVLSSHGGWTGGWGNTVSHGHSGGWSRGYGY